MKKLNLKVTADPKFTADDWQLYTSSMKCTRVANSLNRSLKTLVNSGKSRQDVYESMIAIMYLYSKYGATDTVVREVLLDMLDEIFKD